MSVEAPARRADVQLAINGKQISDAIMQRCFLSMSYQDSENDEADDLEIQLADRDGLWAEQWLNDAIQQAVSGKRAETVQGTTGTGASYRVTAKSGLNVRSGPGTGYGLLGALVYGATVTVLGIDGDWASVDYGGRTAYAYATYLAPTGAAGSGTGSATREVEIEAAIIRRNRVEGRRDERLNCGRFTLDGVEYSGPPGVVTIKATALTFRKSIRQTKKSRAWEAYHLSGIAREMGQAAGLEVLYLPGKDPYYQREEQYKESDISFLKELCDKAGLSLKCCDKSLVIYDQREFEAKPPSFTIRKAERFHRTYLQERDYIGWSFSVGTAEVQYQSCRVSYYTGAGALIEGYAYAPDYDAEEDGQQLEITAKVASVGEAEALAEKLLRLHNKYSVTAEISMDGRPDAAAGQTCMVQGWGGWDGKYFVLRAAHSVDEDGYQTRLTLRRVLDGY